MTVTEEFRAARDRLLDLRTNYTGALAEFQWPAFTEFNFGLDWFDAVAKDSARAGANALVIVEKDGSSTRRTWAELSARSSQVANWMRSIGMKRGEKMIVMLGNRVELWEIMLAGIKLGMVMIPTTTQMTPADLQDRVDRGGARWALAGTGDTQKFDKLTGDYTVIHVDGNAPSGALDYSDSAGHPAEFVPEVPTKADETLLLYFTSGTTSKAKLVEHTHTSYPVGHLSTMFWIGLEPGDVHLNVASPGWAKHAWSNFFAPWIAEATVFLYNYDRFDAKALMAQMDAESVTSFCAPPTVWRLLIQADLTALKNPPTKLVSAGEPLNAEVIDQVNRAWGQTIRDGFGQTETTVQIANPPGLPIKIGAMGRPMPGYDVVLIDPATGAAGREGEICLRLDPRPLGLMKSYYGDAEKTADAFRDSVYHTGDMAEMDEQGVITYVGRGDDVFKSSDYRLSPFELESVLIQHPAVAEAAVVPSPDALRLSVPKAFVVAAEGYAPSAELAESILRHCRENLAPYKRIRRLEFADLPKTISGKIRRVELRRNEVARHEGTGGLEAQGMEYRDDDFPSLKS
ncbi:AMP-binding protein [Paeniglutamicibacter psychrophenolicus]|uniref:Acetyl-CoA synthetase n=1 Tax=Paeniglutamicibacter psychrophenolicus TaxID=257454 RepID=A0ABS4W868_9MICC|nr:AMP-binding protein [Paeniglutamicibacter psychrophenolicus]MBP2372392.1 acetyl-CoA synthetase [Paeniglutamicibacter psychrophenolicus]